MPQGRATRRGRGYAETVAYYVNNNKYSLKAIDFYLNSLKAGDCFSWFTFPEGHSYPFSAKMVTTGWFGRWLGLYPAAPVPPLPDILAHKALNIGPLPKGKRAAASGGNAGEEK